MSLLLCHLGLSEDLTLPLCFRKSSPDTYSVVLPKERIPFFTSFFFIPFLHLFLSLSFPSTVSSAAVLLPSTRKILELSVLGLFLPLTDQGV